MVNVKKYIDIEDIYDGCNNINELSWNGGDDEEDEDMTDYYLQQNINRLNKLYITNSIKKEEMENKMDIDDDIDVDENINTLNRKLSQKSLMYNIENKQFHELIDNASIENKVRLISLKSSKSSTWLQRQIGYNIRNKYEMSNDQFSKITRLQYGMNVVPKNMNEKLLTCSRCGDKMDIYGIHALNCKSGKGATWRHNEMNKFITKLIGEITQNYHLEPCKLQNENALRPDIIIYDQIEYEPKKYAPIYIDTMITDIYNKKNMQQIENGEFSIFNAGKNAENYKLGLYLNRFNDLKEKGFIFIPTIIESTGGINSGLRRLINFFLEKKAESKQKDYTVIAHNYYIEFAIFYQKLKYESLWDHYKII